MPHATRGGVGESAELERPEASLIFSGKELQRYCGWLRENYQFDRTTLAPLPTAIQYHDFQEWQQCRRMKELNLLDTSPRFPGLESHICSGLSNVNLKDDSQCQRQLARLCRHVLHPAGPRSGRIFADRCPCCLVNIHLRYMEALANAVEELKELAQIDKGWTEKYSRICEAWVTGKIQVTHLIYCLEEDAQKERHWQNDHPTEQLEDIMSAAEAVDRYWSSLSAVDLPHAKCARAPVRFTDGTKFDAGRPQAYFKRNSPRYEPGTYALPETEADVDTPRDDEEGESNELDPKGEEEVYEMDDGGDEDLDSGDNTDVESDGADDNLTDGADENLTDGEGDHDADDGFIVFGH